jgi:hypothetical protein
VSLYHGAQALSTGFQTIAVLYEKAALPSFVKVGKAGKENSERHITLDQPSLLS